MGGVVPERTIDFAGRRWAGFDWSLARVAFTTSGGASWVCSSSAVPASGPVQPRINLWLYEGAAPELGLPWTVTIDDFRYTPPSG